MENTKQKVVRTYCGSYKSSNTEVLQAYLNEGYNVLMVTPLVHTETSSYKDKPENLRYQINEYILNPPNKTE